MVMNFFANDCGGRCAAFDKSVLFWTQKFEYMYEPVCATKVWRIRIRLFERWARFRNERREKGHWNHSYTRRRNIGVGKRDVFGIYYPVKSGRVRSG